jgi:hypothetical protein
MPRGAFNARRKWSLGTAVSCDNCTLKCEKKRGPEDLFGEKCRKTGIFGNSLIDN